MKSKLKPFLLGALRFAPFTACAAFMIIYLFGGKELSAEEIVNFTPDNKLFAAMFMVTLYAFKSITVFFPVSVLNIAGGFLFTPSHAILVNSVGVIAELSVPYWLGRLFGKSFAQRQLGKHPKIVEFMERHSINSVFKAFIVRFVYIIPRDGVSRYLGTTKLPFSNYLLGSFLGVVPSMVATTLLGAGITDLSSPLFVSSIIATLTFSIVSIVIYWRWSKRKEGSHRNNER